MPLLEAKGIVKIFGKLTALSGAALTVSENEFHGLIGPNGSGKSTLMKCVAGAETPTEGSVSFAGRDITALSPTGAALHEQVMAMLNQFRLADRAQDAAATLSHGQQQWLEIAMALAGKPRLLLLDEPTGGMSLEERRVTGELLQPIKAKCSLVIVEHDLDFIRDICDRLTVLDQGRVLESGTVAEIQASKSVQEIYLRRA